MSKYKVGDKFIVEIERVGEFLVAPGNVFRLKGIDATLSEKVLDSLHKVDSNMKIEDITDMIAEYDTEKKGYNKGLQDAWKVALKFSQMVDSARDEVFGVTNPNYFFKDMQPQEALAKIEAYEKAQEIQVGDVVRHKNAYTKGVVTRIIPTTQNANICFSDGSACLYNLNEFEKTGKHIHIQALLQEIGGE